MFGACVVLQVKNAVGGVLYCSLRRAEGEPRCWSVFTASVERKGGRARADDLEGVQRQGPCLGELPQGDTATAYLFLHFYFFFILFHSTAFISLSSLSLGGLLQQYFLPTPGIVLSADTHFLRVEMLLSSLLQQPGWIINLSVEALWD